MKLRLALVVLTAATTAVLAGPHKNDSRPDPKDAINIAYRDIGFMAANKKDMGHSGATEMSKKLADHAAACSAEAKSRLDGGEAPDTIVHVTAFAAGNREVKLGEAEATVCKVVADAAGTWDKDVKGAHADEDAKVAAPYKAAGIGGDKLAYIIHEKGMSDFFGVGGNLLKTPEDVKKASVIFTLVGGGDTKWTLHRNQFNGDKAAGTSSQDFISKPGGAAYK